MNINAKTIGFSLKVYQTRDTSITKLFHVQFCSLMISRLAIYFIKQEGPPSKDFDM